MSYQLYETIAGGLQSSQVYKICCFDDVRKIGPYYDAFCNSVGRKPPANPQPHNDQPYDRSHEGTPPRNTHFEDAVANDTHGNDGQADTTCIVTLGSPIVSSRVNESAGSQASHSWLDQPDRTSEDEPIEDILSEPLRRLIWDLFVLYPTFAFDQSGTPVSNELLGLTVGALSMDYSVMDRYIGQLIQIAKQHSCEVTQDGFRNLNRVYTRQWALSPRHTYQLTIRYFTPDELRLNYICCLTHPAIIYENLMVCFDRVSRSGKLTPVWNVPTSVVDLIQEQYNHDTTLDYAFQLETLKEVNRNPQFRIESLITASRVRYLKIIRDKYLPPEEVVPPPQNRDSEDGSVYSDDNTFSWGDDAASIFPTPESLKRVNQPPYHLHVPAYPPPPR